VSMARRPIIAGHDPKSDDRAAVRLGVTVARFTHAPLIVVSVQSGPLPVPLAAGQSLPYAVGTVDPELLEDCAPAVEEIAAELEDDDITVQCRTLTGTSAAQALHAAAEAEDAALLVVGAGRHRLGQVLPAPTAERLLHGAPCPVATAPYGWRPRGALEQIGVAFVDTPEGRAALSAAYALARRAKARLRVITVVRPSARMYADIEPQTAVQRGKTLEDVLGEHKLLAIRAAKLALAPLGGDVEVEIDAPIGDPANTLVDLSRFLGLLVCGSRGFGPLRAVLLGSVSRHVVAEAHCPALVLPRGVEAALDALLAEPRAVATAA
jgi:nucleotide-binding universal stress UspA family protein